MKQLIDYVKTYYREEFKWQYGLFILLFGLLLLYLNYFFPATREIHREGVALYQELPFLACSILWLIALVGSRWFYLLLHRLPHRWGRS